MSQTPSVFIANDPSLNLETDSYLKKFVNFFFVPIINNLPKDFKKIIKKSNKSAGEVIDNATNHKALEMLYKKGDYTSKSSLTNFFQYIWFNLGNSKAVRNRLKLVRKELKDYLTELAPKDKEINIISIASGSSRAIIETVNEEEYLPGTKLSLTFLDKDEKAIQYSKRMSETIHHENIACEWINDSVGNYLRSNPSKKFDVVEIVGLMDYFTDEKLVETFKGIHSLLQEGGIVITANISNNPERKFITRVIDWPMIYRSAEKLGTLIHDAGFSYDKMKVFYEPLKVHGMVVAKK